jgi:15-cis-phytoene synthase
LLRPDTDFSVDLTLDRPGDAMSHQSDLTACRDALRDGSKSFLAASLLLPRRVHEPAAALYAFCRLADDAVDGVQGLDARARRLAAVEGLGERLDRVYAGNPAPHAADRALSGVVLRHGIPRPLFDALLEGFRWDAQERRYETFEQLLDYCARVAGTVGAMMSLVMGARSRQALARACDLGVAMQLSNIARDVGEDARNGRVYLPADWLREAGVDRDAFVAEPVFTPALGNVVRRLLGEADALYGRVDAGVSLLPRACRPGIDAARFLYAAIGHEVARRGLDSVSARARVGNARKGLLMARALSRSLAIATDTSRAGMPPLAANRFLVEAATRGVPSTPPDRARRSVSDRIVWTLELFARVEQRRQSQGAGPRSA